MGPSEHLGAKINNPIAAVSGCPQALDSLNYLSVVSPPRPGVSASQCLSESRDERACLVNSPPLTSTHRNPPTPPLYDCPSRRSLDPDP